MIITVIPARLASTRLPNKMILADTGKPLLCHTVERVLESKFTNLVFVVSQDKEIVDLINGYNFGDRHVKAILTGPADSGTERIAKFCTTYLADDSHTIVNFQGDEPELSGLYIDRLADAVRVDLCDVATLASPIDHDVHNRDVVKVVLNHSSEAVWFSRYAIPMGGPWLRHVGIYAYKVKFLRKLFLMTPTTAVGEKLEQLQWLQSGYRIKVVVDDIVSSGIDSSDDYEGFVLRQRSKK